MGGQARKVRMALKQDSPGGTSIYQAGAAEQAGSGEVEVLALGDWLEQTGGAFDLLKLDCEGAEWEILRRTSPSAFARFGALVAEVHDDPEEASPVERFGALAEACGFRTVRWERKGKTLYLGVRDRDVRL